MELETINKLYLKLAQIATAKTQKQIDLERRNKQRGKLLQDIGNHSEVTMPPDLWKRISDELMHKNGDTSQEAQS